MNQTKRMSNSTGVLVNALIQYAINQRGKCQIFTHNSDANLVALTFTDHACTVHICPPQDEEGGYVIDENAADVVLTRGGGCTFLEALAEVHHASFNGEADFSLLERLGEANGIEYAGWTIISD